MYKTLNLVKMLIAIGLLLSGSAANAKMQDWLLKEKVDEFEQLIIKNHIPNCLNVSSYYDRVYCAQKAYSVMDDLLNIEYKELRMKLTKKWTPKIGQPCKRPLIQAASLAAS